ncbi:MAG: CusA/CzcA family heavy metal efflux RND transporter [Bacteroidia bacterium]
MLSNIISFSLRNKLIIGLLTLGLIIWGSYSFTQLPIDAVPDITNNQVQVVSTAPDLAAPEVERLITFPIEQALATIPGKVELRSFSRFGLSLVTIVFTDETDVYWARQQVTERLSQAMSIIPQGLTQPELAPVTTGLGEIYQYTLKVDKRMEGQYSLADLRTIQDWIIKRQLLGTPGLADVSSFGGNLKQYEVSVKPGRLRSMEVSLDEICRALEKNNQNTGGSYIEKGSEALLIRTEGLIESKADIEQIVIRNSSNGIPLLVKDVSEVTEGKAVRYGAMTRDSSGEAVGGVVLMLKGANSSEVIKDVKARIANISKTLPEGISIDPYLDRTKLVDRAISTVSKNLAEGALIVIFVLVLLLGNIRAGLIVASVIPLAMLFALGMMNIFGVSGNLMSLGALDFGLIVDGAVIIVEAVIHRLYISHALGGAQEVVISRNEIEDTVRSSAGKMMRWAAFGQLIILIVYVPILSLIGIEGKMFKPMAQTVSFAIIGALILSLTYVPVASALFLNKKLNFKKSFSDKFIDAISSMYKPILQKALAFPLISSSIAIGSLLITLVVFTNLGGEFIPSLDEGDFSIETRLLTGSSLSESVKVSNQAGKILMEQFPEVLAVTGKIGTSEIPTDPMPIEATDLIVSLKDRADWTSATSKEELALKMGAALSAIPGATFGFQQPIQMRFNELMTGARQDVVVKVFGEDLNELSKLASQVNALAKTVEGATDFYEEQIDGLPQIVVRIKRDAIARYGISVEDINRTINTAYAGREAGYVYEGEKRFSLVVRLSADERTNYTNMRELFIEGANGNMIPISEVADIGVSEGPVQIQREDARRRIIVGFNVRNRDVESVVEELQQKVEANLSLNPGYSVTFGGQFENLIEANKRLSIAVPVSLLLILLLLFFAFGSIKYSLLIFTAVPFSAIGGVFALYLRDLPFSISAGVGFIALFGVAVLNGIVLIGAFNQIKNAGIKDINERIMQGTSERLRPILMTALVASLGFLPMALSSSAGAEVQRPLATVVIGGLITATLLTLILLPVFYMLLEKGFRIKAKPLIIFLLVLTAGNGYSQTAKNISLDSAIAFAQKAHPDLLTHRSSLESVVASKKSAYDIGNFTAGIMGGKYNSNYDDFQFNFQQSIPFPSTFVRKSEIIKSEIQFEKALLDNEELIIKRNISHLWHAIAFQKAKILVLDSLNSLSKRILDISILRVKSGEAILLEELSLRQKSGQMQLDLQNEKSKLLAMEYELSRNCGSNEPLSATTWKFGNRNALVPVLSGFLANSHPIMISTMKHTEMSIASMKLERSKLLPEIHLGYFNQSLIGLQNIDGQEQFFTRADRFSGYTAGLSFPLWFIPQQARVKSYKLKVQQAQNEQDSRQLKLEIEYNHRLNDMMIASNELDFIESTALPTAEIAIKNAELSWKSGDLSYLELFYAIEQKQKIENQWLQALSKYTEAVLQVNYLQNR